MARQAGAAVDLEGSLYRHRPNLDLDLGSYRLRTNRLGFRGPQVEVRKPAGTFRILVLGDSVAFGLGVDEEVTFLQRWQGELRERLGRPVEVINTGHPMYDTSQELAVLRDEGLALAPDLVLLIYVVNDIEPTRDIVEEVLLGKVPAADEVLPDPGDFWTRLASTVNPVTPAIATWLRLQSDPASRYLSTQPDGAEYVPENVGKGPRGWARSRKALLTIRDLCAEAKVPFVLLDHSLPAIRSLPPFCHEHGVPYFEFRWTPAELRQPIRNSMLDTHANAAGHELLLQKLRVLEPELPLPR